MRRGHLFWLLATPAILPMLWSALVLHLMLSEENNRELHAIGGQIDTTYVSQLLLINFGLPYALLLMVTLLFYSFARAPHRRD